MGVDAAREIAAPLPEMVRAGAIEGDHHQLLRFFNRLRYRRDKRKAEGEGKGKQTHQRT